MKLLYNVPEANNYWFATYHTHYKEKLGIRESTYNPCLFFRSELFGFVEIQINNTLILANENFANNEEEAIKLVKIMTKNGKYLTLTHLLKFNDVQIKLNSNSIVLIN